MDCGYIVFVNGVRAKFNLAVFFSSINPVISDGDMLTTLGITTDDPTLTLLGSTSPDAQSLLSQSVNLVATNALLLNSSIQSTSAGSMPVTSFGQSVLSSFVDELHDVMTYVSPTLDKFSDYGKYLVKYYGPLYEKNLNLGLTAWINAQQISSPGTISNDVLAMAQQYWNLKFGSQIMSKLTWVGIAAELKMDYDQILAAPPGIATYVEATEDIGGTTLGLVTGAFVGIRTRSFILAGLAAYSIDSFWKGAVGFFANEIISSPIANDNPQANRPSI